MELVVVLLAFVLLAIVLAVIGAPLRATPERPAGEQAGKRAEHDAPDRAELEAQREIKYREIRDVELDYRTGKLSPEDYASIDASLRAEALAILNRLDALAEPSKADSEVEG